MKKKILALCLVIVLAATAVIGGTLAYFTDEADATNTFTVGKVKIELDETKVNPDGTPIPDEDRVTGNDYHLIPAHTYTKDPEVTVKAGSEPSYVRILVTLNKAKELKEIFGENFKAEDYVDGWDSTVWPCVKTTADANANTITYEFRYHTVAEAPKSEDLRLLALFTHFTVPAEATVEDLAKLGDTDPSEEVDNSFKIDIKAQAIQADGFANADAAWTAFEAN